MDVMMAVATMQDAFRRAGMKLTEGHITVSKGAFPDVALDDFFTVEVTREDGGSTETFVDCPVVSIGDSEFTVSVG